MGGNHVKHFVSKVSLTTLIFHKAHFLTAKNRYSLPSLKGKKCNNTLKGALWTFLFGFVRHPFLQKKGQKKAPSVKKDVTCLLYKKKLSSYIFQLAQRSILSQNRIYTFRECRTSPCNFCHPWVFTTVVMCNRVSLH